MDTMAVTPSVLFICTGNYYRSRFAEAYFRYESSRRGLGWDAQSRGLSIDNPENEGPISPHASAALAALGVPYERRSPQSLDRQALQQATIRVAVDREEHWPMLGVEYEDWLSRIEFWQIEDIDRKPPADALARLKVQLDGLLQRVESREAGPTESRSMGGRSG